MIWVRHYWGQDPTLADAVQRDEVNRFWKEGLLGNRGEWRKIGLHNIYNTYVYVYHIDVYCICIYMSETNETNKNEESKRRRKELKMKKEKEKKKQNKTLPKWNGKKERQPGISNGMCGKKWSIRRSTQERIEQLNEIKSVNKNRNINGHGGDIYCSVCLLPYTRYSHYIFHSLLFFFSYSPSIHPCHSWHCTGAMGMERIGFSFFFRAGKRYWYMYGVVERLQLQPFRTNGAMEKQYDGWLAYWTSL